MSGDRKSMRPEEIRALFERAHPPRPDAVDRLSARVPGLLAEAARRGPAPSATVGDAIVPLAARWLPAMAAAAVLLVGAVLVVGTANGAATDGAANGDGGLDRLVLLGSWNGDSEDVLLRALVTGEEETR